MSRPFGSDCPECRIGDCYCGYYTHCNEHYNVDECGMCPIGHDGSYCKDCEGPNISGKCHLGHDGTRCVHCNELNIYRKCIHKHTGETCSVCNELMSWFNGTAKCPKMHDGTRCTICNTANKFSIVDSIECPKCRPGMRNITFEQVFEFPSNYLPTNYLPKNLHSLINIPILN